MTTTVGDEITLNSNKYRIKGPVTGGWLDPFTQQMVIGDADYASRIDLSSWIMNDLRGGIGVEEMDEKVDQNKCWWTDCIIKYRNHILPPRLATAITNSHNLIKNYGLENWTTATDCDDWTETLAGTTAINRESTTIHGGTYSAKLTSTVANMVLLEQNVSWNNILRET